MIIIRPLTFTDAMLSNFNVAETDESEWDSATAYSIGDLVMETASGVHKIYEALKASTNKYPPDYSNKTIPTPADPEWLEVEPTNRWAMFEPSISTQTENATSITFDFDPGVIIDSMAFFNLDATSVQVVMDDPTNGEVYNQTYDLQSAVIDSWYAFFNEERYYKSDLALLDLPRYPSATTTVTITKTGGTAKCGFITAGRQRDIGIAVHGTSIGIVDYSTRTTDSFGTYTITQREYSKEAVYEVIVENDFKDEVQRILASYRQTPMAWIADPDQESTIVFGFYDDFDIVLANTSYSEANIKVIGMT